MQKQLVRSKRKEVVKKQKWRVDFVDSVPSYMATISDDSPSLWSDSVAVCHRRSKRIIIKRGNIHEETERALHEFLHAIMPRFSESTVLALEKHLIPILWKHGFRYYELRKPRKPKSNGSK